MKALNAATFFLLFYLLFSGCGTSYKEMSDKEFWNEYEGRFKKKTDSSYIYQVEMFDTEVEYKVIGVYDNPKVTSNFTKILNINDAGNADTSLFYTIRITQSKKGFEKITKPVNNEVPLNVDGMPILMNIKYKNVEYVPPVNSAEYGYKNGYYYCDVMCPVSFQDFVKLANAVKITGTLSVTTSVLAEENKSIEGEIKFISHERPQDAQIINRFFNTNPTK